MSGLEREAPAAAAHAPHGGTLLAGIVHVFFFAIWVSICSVAPEIIWQGLLVALRHYDWITVGSAILTGAVVAFFVEPLTERLRAMRLQLAHRHKTTAHATFAAFSFAVLAVFVHEAITAFIAEPYAGHYVKDTLAYAMSEVFQWAWIPFAVTMAWLCAHLGRWISVPVFLLALASIALVGPVFDWYPIDIYTTVVPCLCMLVGGHIVMRKGFDRHALFRCAGVVAIIAAIWLALAGLSQLVLSLFGSGSLVIYTWGEYTIDFRFYLGWVVGLTIAPKPFHETPRP
ncbi:hypothetical protein [Dyella sedimenti]|uniref:hypothetical protein n=1 Tax=Dyella sedimenti TaxID=2919947 RepID=UPI001FAA61F6|nr:hypothetical protein [Dyella sedimenti]